MKWGIHRKRGKDGGERGKEKEMEGEGGEGASNAEKERLDNIA